ncbi:MAG: hypothetical protein J0L62_01520 [Bacteroidetes bacterium]|nr:hypothetical protein [Bacteroidota bacterium]
MINYYLFGESTITCSSLGWGTNYNSSHSLNLVETGKMAALRHTRVDYLNIEYQELYHENISLLLKMINWSNEKKVQLIFVTLPAFESYRNNLNSNQLNFTIDEIKKIVSKYKNCSYFNFIADTNFVAQDFYDGDHLSEIGAKKISTIINSKIMTLPSNEQKLKF